MNVVAILILITMGFFLLRFLRAKHQIKQVVKREIELSQYNLPGLNLLSLSESQKEVAKEIIEKARKSGLDYEDIRTLLAIAFLESSFRKGSQGRGGEIGVFQLSTYAYQDLESNNMLTGDEVQDGINYYQILKRYVSRGVCRIHLPYALAVYWLTGAASEGMSYCDLPMYAQDRCDRVSQLFMVPTDKMECMGGES